MIEELTDLGSMNDYILIMVHVQSDLGYPATSGPAHIRISDLAGYDRYA